MEVCEMMVWFIGKERLQCSVIFPSGEGPSSRVMSSLSLYLLNLCTNLSTTKIKSKGGRHFLEEGMQSALEDDGGTDEVGVG